MWWFGVECSSRNLDDCCSSSESGLMPHSRSARPAARIRRTVRAGDPGTPTENSQWRATRPGRGWKLTQYKTSQLHLNSITSLPLPLFTPRSLRLPPPTPRASPNTPRTRRADCLAAADDVTPSVSALVVTCRIRGIPEANCSNSNPRTPSRSSIPIRRALSPNHRRAVPPCRQQPPKPPIHTYLTRTPPCWNCHNVGHR